MRSNQKILLKKLLIFFPFLLVFLSFPHFIENSLNSPPDTIILRFLLFFGLFFGSFTYFLLWEKEKRKEKQKTELLFILTITFFLFVPNYLWGDDPISFIFTLRHILIEFFVLSVGFFYGLASRKIQ